MLIKYIGFAGLAIALSYSFASADDTHGNGTFHAFDLEMGIGASDDGNDFADWDLDGWIGTDENKLWLRSEGERSDNETEAAEFWAMYSRNIARFWDLQIGIRHDAKPHSLTHAVIGFDDWHPIS